MAWCAGLGTRPGSAALPQARPLALTVPQAAPECGVSSPPPVQVDTAPEQDEETTQRQDRQEGDARADAGHQASVGRGLATCEQIPNAGQQDLEF